MLDNIIKISSGVFSNDECRLLCEDFSCKYFTYYSSGGFPFSETCVLFSSCGSLHTCEVCTTEALCHQLDVSREVCSTHIEGQVEDNLISFLPNKINETSCKDACVANNNCVFYTYHLLNDTGLPGGCSLLSSLLQPFRECDTCLTGPADCSKQCWFLRDGQMTSDGLLIDKTRTSVSLQTVSLHPCQLTHCKK